MKPLTLILACLLSSNLISQQTNTDIDSLNLLFSFPCIAFGGEYGVECDSDKIYTSSCISDSIAKYDMAGNLLEKFVIPEVGNIRDMAYDGEFFYGGTNDTALYVMDFITKNLVVSVNMPFTIQSIAYNDEADVFWVGEEGSPTLYQTDLSGVNLGNVTIDCFDTINITGLAYDNYNWTPHLWVFCQDSSRSTLLKYDIYDNSQVGYEIDFSSLVSDDALSGGLYSDITWDGGILGGLFQDQMVFALDLNYANQLVSTQENTLPTDFSIYPNPASDKVIVSVSAKESQHIICRVFNENSQVLYENDLLSNELEIDIRNYPNGTYFVQLIGSEGYSFTKKFIKSV